MTAATSRSRTQKTPWGRAVIIGVLGGAVAAIGMAMLAMVAAGTYQGTGFFTPMYHIGSVFGGADPMEAMTTSMEQAQAGEAVTWITAPALLGLAVHMGVGMAWGALFGLVVAATRMRRVAVVPAGIAFGILVMFVMAFAVLPASATLFGSGEPIRDMAAMVGWATFTAEHVLFGLILGLTTLPLGSRTIDVTTPTAAARPEPTTTHERTTSTR